MPTSPIETPPPSTARLLDVLSRQSACDRGRLGRLAGDGLGRLIADGVIDRVAARALLLVAEGKLDEHEVRQLVAPQRLRSALDRLADPLDGPPEVAALGVGDRLGRYTVKGLLGRGGSSRVYLALHPVLRVPVALKVPLTTAPAVAVRLRAEAAALAKFSHPNVVRVWDADEADGTPFLALEYVDGESLGQVLRRGDRLRPRKAIRAIKQAARGLRAAHRRGLTHGDVKPANLLTTLDGTVKVADFGLARRTADTVEGTWAYLAPERFDGGGDHRSDLYSLGLTLYHLIAGRPAVRGDFRGCREQHRRLDLEPLHWSVPGATPALDELIRRLTARDPDARPADYDAVLAALTTV